MSSEPEPEPEHEINEIIFTGSLKNGNNLSDFSSQSPPLIRFNFIDTPTLSGSKSNGDSWPTLPTSTSFTSQIVSYQSDWTTNPQIVIIDNSNNRQIEFSIRVTSQEENSNVGFINYQTTSDSDYYGLTFTFNNKTDASTFYNSYNNSGFSDSVTIYITNNPIIFTYSDGSISYSTDTLITSSSYDNSKTLVSVYIGASVTSIGDSAFFGASSLTSITIPASVTSIGDSAFFGASSLATVTFETGSQLGSIGANAFYGAQNLTSITIPASVTRIGAYAFQDAKSLTSIIIPKCYQNWTRRVPKFRFNRSNNILGSVRKTWFSYFCWFW